MQFDTTINPLQFNIAVSETDGHLEFVIVTGTLLPVPQGMLPLPIGVYRVPFPTKASAEEFYEQLGKALEEVPEDKKDSGLVIANNVNQVNQMAEEINRFTK